jgi:hypothetical protein
LEVSLILENITDNRGNLKFFQSNLNLPFRLRETQVITLKGGCYAKLLAPDGKTCGAFILVSGEILTLIESQLIQEHELTQKDLFKLSLNVISEKAILICFYEE